MPLYRARLPRQQSQAGSSSSRFMIRHESGSIDCACVISLPSEMPLLGDDRSGSPAMSDLPPNSRRRIVSPETKGRPSNGSHWHTLGLKRLADGHKRTSRDKLAMSALPPKADISVMRRHACFAPETDILSAGDAPGLAEAHAGRRPRPGSAHRSLLASLWGVRIAWLPGDPKNR